MKYAGQEFSEDYPKPGKGQGKGYPRQRKGGRTECKCPQCGKISEKPRNTPCTDMKCPACGAKMVGA